jgi:hypothetical protein
MPLFLFIQREKAAEKEKLIWDTEDRQASHTPQ